jgi:hypothetical protein
MSFSPPSTNRLRMDCILASNSRYVNAKGPRDKRNKRGKAGCGPSGGLLREVQAAEGGIGSVGRTAGFSSCP